MWPFLVLPFLCLMKTVLLAKFVQFFFEEIDIYVLIYVNVNLAIADYITCLIC